MMDWRTFFSQKAIMGCEIVGLEYSARTLGWEEEGIVWGLELLLDLLFFVVFVISESELGTLALLVSITFDLEHIIARGMRRVAYKSLIKK